MKYDLKHVKKKEMTTTTNECKVIMQRIFDINKYYVLRCTMISI